MKRVGRFVMWGLLLVALLLVGVWAFGPYEPRAHAPSTNFAPGPDLDAYFASVEAQFDDIVPGTQKRVIWAGEAGARTDWVVIYVHGFSASSEEIRPVPDKLAKALGANLIFTRLTGHARGSDAMTEATAQAWVDDLAEAMAAGRMAGERLLVMSTSTGGTLVTALAQNAAVMEGAAGLIFVSPNYGLNSPLAALLGWPAARYWLPYLAGARREFEPLNAEHGTYWTTEYDSVAVMPMVALLGTVADMDHGAHTLPALFWFSEEDKVVRPEATAKMARVWGAPSTVVNPVMGPEDDPYAHVIAGDVLSSSQTGAAVSGMLEWVQSLPQ